MTAHYFLGNRLLGTGRAYWDDITPLREGLALFCPTCGECWGRIAPEGSEEWLPIRAGCPRHPWTDTPGTFLHPWQRQLTGLPPEVLRHEFLIRQHLIGTP